jgi:hypothetical protein
MTPIGRNNAFERYLLSVPRAEAAQHVIECLCHGPVGNAAWELLERYNGQWSCQPEELPQLILNTLAKMAEEHRSQLG